MWYLNSTNFKLSTCIIFLIQFFLVNQWMYTVTLIKRRSNKNYQWNCKTLPLQRIRKRPSNPPPKTNKHKHPPPPKKTLKNEMQLFLQNFRTILYKMHRHEIRQYVLLQISFVEPTTSDQRDLNKSYNCKIA